MATKQHTSIDLPFDIINDILSRLPFKSLVRFKTVCNSWNAMISDPVFAGNHLRRSKTLNPPPEILFIRKSSAISNSEGFSLIKFDNDRKVQNLGVFRGPYGWKDEVVSFCNGVLLLLNFRRTNFILWNPSTGAKQMYRFPYNFMDYCPMSYGLAFDRIVGDFKVVVICVKYYLVYSCNNHAWIRKQNTIRLTTIPNDSGVCVDGNVYWVKMDKNKNGREIVYFDPGGDELKMLQKPENIPDKKPIYLTDLKDRLCVYCNVRDAKTVQIWMKEKGADGDYWKELITAENVAMWLCQFRPLCYVENNILIGSGQHGKFRVYDPLKKKFEEIKDEEYNPGYKLVPHLDSLFFPTRKRMPKRRKI